MRILVTGGLGYIGSHIVYELIKDNHEPVIVDNLENTSYDVLNNLKKLCQKEHITFYQHDIRDKKALQDIFNKEKNLDGVIHLAALKSIPESFEKPLDYYNTNVTGSLNLIELCVEYNIKYFIFSSSACVYGEGKPVVDETMDVNPNNAYGKSKVIIEDVLSQTVNSLNKKKEKEMHALSLRYFNPVGCHESGLIGDLAKKDSNLFKVIERVATKELPTMQIFGKDWNTRDGTPIRDFIHVNDIAEGHIRAIKYLKKEKENTENASSSYDVFNMGTEKGHSVQEVLDCYINVNSIEIPYSYGPRREGDLEMLVSNSSKIQKAMSWKAERTLEEMCRSSYKWCTTSAK